MCGASSSNTLKCPPQTPCNKINQQNQQQQNPHMYEHSTLICSLLTVLSSIISISFMEAPNSLSR